eukprot:2524640-Pyramimonas_sp.AAC.1
MRSTPSSRRTLTYIVLRPIIFLSPFVLVVGIIVPRADVDEMGELLGLDPEPYRTSWTPRMFGTLA